MTVWSYLSFNNICKISIYPIANEEFQMRNRLVDTLQMIFGTEQGSKEEEQ